MRNRIRRWTTDENAKYADTNTDIQITFDTHNHTVTGLHRTLKTSER